MCLRKIPRTRATFFYWLEICLPNGQKFSHTKTTHSIFFVSAKNKEVTCVSHADMMLLAKKNASSIDSPHVRMPLFRKTKICAKKQNVEHNGQADARINLPKKTKSTMENQETETRGIIPSLSSSLPCFNVLFFADRMLDGPSLHEAVFFNPFPNAG